MKIRQLAIGILIMSSMIASPQAVKEQKSLGTFDLINYERKEAFAGKLGNRVREKLTLKRGSKQYTLEFQAYHTRISGQTVKPFCPGCPIEIRCGKFVRNTIVANRKDVVQLHEKSSEGHSSQ